jgi:hypothetical protein
MASKGTGDMSGDSVLADVEAFVVPTGCTGDVHVAPLSVCGRQCVQPQRCLGPRLVRCTDNQLDLHQALWSLRLHVTEL